MKEIIRDRLEKMNDLEQRQHLKMVMSNVFLKLEEHNQAFYERLQERIFEEVDTDREKYEIYGTVCKREALDPFHSSLFLLVSQDIEQKVWDMKELSKAIGGVEDMKLLTIFMECDFFTIEKMMGLNQTFTGQVVTDKAAYEIELFLARNRSYQLEVEKLYHIFLKNDLPWRTVHHPYLAKFVDVYVKPNTIFPAEEDEKILEIKFHLGEFDVYKRMDVVPLWNVRKVAVRDTVFPVPALDRINFEHVIELQTLGTEHGYLVDGDPEIIRYVKRTDTALTIVTEIDDQFDWEMYQVAASAYDPISFNLFEITTNKRKDTFLDQYVHQYGHAIRSVAEISRIVQSFELGVRFYVNHVEIVEQNAVVSETYPLNTFMHDNVRDEQYKRVMLIRFELEGVRNITTEDSLSYIVSEIQQFFPEYQCVGVLR